METKQKTPKTAEELLKLATRAIEKKRYKTAERLCHRALGLKGACEAAILEVRGRALARQENFELALKDLDQSYALGWREPSLIDSKCGLLLDLKRYTEALEFIDFALKENPRNGFLYHWRGTTLSWFDKWDESVGSLTLAIENGYTHYTVYLDRARYHSYLNKFEESLQDYDTALSKKSDAVSALIGRAKIKWKLEQYEEAENDFDIADRLDPTSSRSPFERGRLLYSDKEYERAVRFFELAVERSPDEKSYRLWRGTTYYQLDDCVLADHDLSFLSECQEAGESELFWTGCNLIKLNDFRGALQYFEKAIERNPNNSNYFGWQGHLLSQLEEWEKAGLAYDRAIQLDPNYPYYYEKRSIIWDQLGCEDLAAVAFRQCEELEFQNEQSITMNEPATDLFPIVREHFQNIPIESFSLTERLYTRQISPDIQIALNALEESGLVINRFFTPKQENCPIYNFQSLYSRDRRKPIVMAAPHYFESNIGTDTPIRCLTNGVWLLTLDNEKLAVLTTIDNQHRRFQVAASDTPQGKAATAAFFAHLEKVISRGECYRGKILSLEEDESYEGTINGLKVHQLRHVTRDDVILPNSTIDLLERNIIEFVRLRSKLREIGLSTRKGILFYGPPGTGKTHTIHYLARALPNSTTFLITADHVGLLKDYMALARLYQPSIVVLEDVDLIARNRQTLRSGYEETLLNRLLNEMDGLKPDADILFILTTNAPEALEEALANRPGRIDQGIEFPLPDRDGRVKLAKLYAGSLGLPAEIADRIADRPEPMSAAFIKELMRRTIQSMLARDSNELALSDVDIALEEMLMKGSLKNQLFGFIGK